MSKTKRLFLFAGYEKDGIIDDTLIWYLNALSELGDIIFVMDCDVKDTSKLKKVKNILHTEIARHGEYDFGSYKRGYIWVHDKKILNKYDWVYLVNDSVYGPLFDLEPCLVKMESKHTDLVGLTSYYDEYTPLHIQSWFVGLSHKIANSSFVYDFMKSIRHRDLKSEIICKYEVGLSRMILQHGYKMSTLFVNQERSHTVYDKPKILLENLIPFIKKQALENIGGTVYLLPYTSDEFVEMIYANAERTGIKYSSQDVDLTPKKIFRFSLFGIPLCTIYRSPFINIHPTVYYKVYLFDRIRIIKIIKRQ